MVYLLILIASFTISGFAQDNVELTTSGSDLIAALPQGGDLFLMPVGGDRTGVVATLASNAEERGALSTAVSSLDAARLDGEAQLRSTLTESDSSLRSTLEVSESTLAAQVSTINSTITDTIVEISTSSASRFSQLAAAAESRAQESAEAAQAAEAQLSTLKNHLLPKTPAFSISPTPFGARVKVSPVFSVLPYNITVYYTGRSSASQDISQWESMVWSPPDEFDEQETLMVSGMSPQQAYSIKVAATSAVGDSALSAVINFQTTEAKGADTFGCQRSSFTCAAGRTCTVCEVVYSVGVRSFMYTGITGTYKANGNSWVALGVSYNNDNSDPSTRANQAKSNGVGRSRQWEQIHAARASSELAAGRQTIKIQFKCTGSGSCQLQNVGMQGMVVLKESGMLAGSCRGDERVNMRWATKVCEINFRASVPSIDVMSVNGGIYTGHYYVNGAYDSERGRWEGNKHAPAHSYARDYESFGTGRAVALSAGSHVVTANGFHGSATYWKAGISHLLFPADRSQANGRNQVFKRWPGWGQHANRNGRALITQTINLPYDSLVFAQFAGHYRAQSGNQCFGMVMFDNDMVDWFRSNSKMYAESGEHMVASGRSTQWENFQSKRFKLLPRGRHTVSVWLRAESSNCWLNGMGMDGFWTKNF